MEEFVPKKIRAMLAMCPKQEVRPVRFTEWAEEYIECLKRIEGIDNAARRKQFREVAGKYEYGWSKAQIRAALYDNGLM
jgi:hypothetical protein